MPGGGSWRHVARGLCCALLGVLLLAAPGHALAATATGTSSSSSQQGARQLQVQQRAQQQAQQQQAQQDAPVYSCDAISKVPSELRCSFVRSSCPSESIVPYAEWYFCSVARHNVVLRSLYVAAVCCLLPLAFCLLGDTAEFYIAPIMAHVSQAIPKMRPRFAGVTFVALGNGAPDLSANIAAISAGEVVLSAGALTGAAMFVQCVVAAELVSLAGDAGIKCGGAMLRDVGVYCLAITSVLLAFALGQITRAFVGWAIALYLIYMVWVFAGDEWHQRGRPQPKLDPAALRALLARVAGAPGGLQPPPQGARASTSGGGGGLGALGGRGELEEALLPWAVAEDEEEQQQLGLLQPRVSAGPPEFLEAQPFGPRGGGGGVRPGSVSAFAPPAGRVSSSSRPPSVALSTELSAVSGGGSFTFAAQPERPTSPAQRSADGLSRPASVTSPRLLQPQHSGAAAGPGPQPGGGWLRAGRSGGRPGQPHVMSLGGTPYIDAKTYKQLVWADLADDDEEEARLEREIAQQLLAGVRRSQHLGTASAPGAVGAGGAGSYRPPQLSGDGSSGLSSPMHQHQLAAAAAAAALEEGHAARHGHPQQHAATAGGAAPRAAAAPELLSPLGSADMSLGSLSPVRTVPGVSPASDSALTGPDRWPEAAAAAGVRRLSGPGQATLRSSLDGQSPSPWLRLPGALGSREQQWLPPGGSGGGGAAPNGAPFPVQHAQQQGSEAGDAGDTWQQLQWQLTLGNSEEWLDAGPLLRLFRKVTFPLLLPAYLGQRLTIPFASASGYSREWLISSLLCCPLALITYLGLLTLPSVLCAAGAGVAAAAAGAALTAWDGPGRMPGSGLGWRAAAALPGLLAVLAFIMGVVWIDTVASEVVGVLTFLAGLAALPAGVVGLTLLAWGNSLGDFFGNRAMARAGHGSTAITACFAAPLFNMLISLAAGFSAYLAKRGATSVAVELTPEVALGCLFLIGYNAAIICVGRRCGQRLPPWFAGFARAWYGAYFCLAVASGFWQQRRGDGGGGGGGS